MAALSKICGLPTELILMIISYLTLAYDGGAARTPAESYITLGARGPTLDTDPESKVLHKALLTLAGTYI